MSLSTSNLRNRYDELVLVLVLVLVSEKDETIVIVEAMPRRRKEHTRDILRETMRWLTDYCDLTVLHSREVTGDELVLQRRTGRNSSE